MHRLRDEVGALLRGRRATAGLSQDGLARVAGVSQTLVSRVERGLIDASLDLIERLFAVLDLQLRLGLEHSGAHLDSEIDRLMLTPAADRVASCSHVLGELNSFGVVYEGPIAAALHGVPLPVDATDIVLPSSAVEDFAAWLTRRAAQRWSDRWKDFSNYYTHPKEPGRLYWRMALGDVRARICAELPPSVVIVHDERSYRVRPLLDLELADPMLEALLRRYRERALRS